jgi:hypothetical protein
MTDNQCQPSNDGREVYEVGFFQEVTDATPRITLLSLKGGRRAVLQTPYTIDTDDLGRIVACLYTRLAR